MCIFGLPLRKQGEGYAKHARFWAGKAVISILCIYSAAYYLKYNSNVSVEPETRSS